MIRAVSTNWDRLKMPKRCRKFYSARLDRSIHSLSCQKEREKKHTRTQCNFHFLNVDCTRSENACNVNKTGAKCSINFQKQRLWSWSWKTKEQMYMVWNLCLHPSLWNEASKHSNRCSCETEAESVAQQSSLPINPALVLGYAQLQGSCRKAQGCWYAVKILITSIQANNNCCSFLMLLIFFPPNARFRKRGVCLLQYSKLNRKNLTVF